MALRFLSFFLFIYTVLAVDCSIAAFSSLVPSNATVTLASQITKHGKFSQDGINITIASNVTNDALPICALNIQVQSSANTSFNMGLLLPSNWNGRMMATGNPGFGGGIRWDFMGSVLRYGPAISLSTDTGHIGAPNNISFAVNNPDGIIDWSYRSLHYSTVLAKQLAKSFYDQDVKHSYYTACSNGGRQGLKEVQMFPDDYDGVLVGAPPWWITHLHPWALQVGIWNLPAGTNRHVPSNKFDMVYQEIMNQCDAQDGLTDGIVSEPYSCNFNSSALLCDATATNTSACLQKEQIDTLSLMYNDWIATNGSLIHPRFPISAPASRFGQVTTDPNHFGLEYFYGFVYNNTDWDWKTFQGETTVEYVDSINAGDAAALSFDLSEFRNNGGKVILYHGLADPTIPTGSSILYYQSVQEAMFPSGASGNIDDFFKFYLIPGMAHCGSSTVAPYYIAAAGQVVSTAQGHGFSTPGYVDTKHDVFLAMMDWVEQGNAPQELIATKWNNDTLEDGLSMQRPLCPYPQRSQYDGQGDWHQASSWTCVDGDTLQFPIQNGSVGTIKAIDQMTGIYNPEDCGNNCTAYNLTDLANASSTQSGAARPTSSKSAAVSAFGGDSSVMRTVFWLLTLGLGAFAL
jgi:feruloyl esterase